MPNMELLLALLAAATLLSGLARRVSVPYPIVLVISGAVLAVVPGIPDVRVPPNVVFLVFLPPLLYAGSLFSSPVELRHNAAGILLLAIGLVLATVAAVALVGRYVVGLTWPEGFVLGAILGATDPIAATAIIRRLGAPERISTLLEGEALVNDGTSLTVFKVALGAVGAHSFSIGHGILQFVEVSFGGVAIGAVVGFASIWTNRHLDDPDLEIAVGILAAYGAYVAADWAGVSGVLATVTAGVLSARFAGDIYSPGTRLRSNSFWQTTSFILNALLFLLIGLQLHAATAGIHDASIGTLSEDAAAVVGVLILLRLGWMYAIPTLLPPIRRRLPGGQIRSSWREQLILGWSGMRGALSLAAALSLPFGGRLADRGLVVFLSFVTILVTLALPGLTLVPLIRTMRLGQSERRVRQALEARRQLIRAALAAIDEAAEEDELPARTLARFRDLYETRLDALERRLEPEDRDEDGHEDPAAERHLRSRLLGAQRSTLRELELARRAPVEVIREIEHDLDLESARLPRM